MTKPGANEVNATQQPATYTIHVIAKAIDLLELLGRTEEPLGLADISRQLDLPKSSVFRYLATLEQRGLVRRMPDGDKFKLGLKLLELGSLVVGQSDVREAALPVMRELHDTFQETVNLAVFDDYQVVYLDVLEGKSHSVRMVGRPGQRQLAHSTALGKAIMAHWSPDEVATLIQRYGLPAFTEHTRTTEAALKEDLARAYRDGYAIDDEESDLGVRCVGAAIFDHQRVAVAGISVSAPAHRMPVSQVEAVTAALVDAAARISKQLGFRK